MRTSNNHAIDWLLPPTRIGVLAVLLPDPARRCHLRELARRIGLAAGSVKREVAILTKAGVLLREEDGNRVYYRANTGCPFYPELRDLLLKTAGLGDVVRDALEPLRDKIVVAFIYGSLAKGGERPDSDVDLMVIGKASFSGVVDAIHPAQEKLGREVNPTVYSIAEFQSKLGANHHFLSAVMERGKIFIIGDEDELGKLAP